MGRNLVLATLAIVLLISPAFAKIYNDYISINSRVPGDQLLWQSSHAKQNLNFFASVRVEVANPENIQKSAYILSHVLITGKDDTGYIDAKFDAGGPGTDNMKLKMIFNSIQNADFEIFVYGKKK